MDRPGDHLVLAPPGARSLPAMLTRHVRRTHERFVHVGPALAPAWHTPHARAVSALRTALANAPRTALLFTSPPVASPLHTFALRDALTEFTDRIDRALEDSVAHVLLELAHRGLLVEPVVCPLPSAPLASPALAVAFVPPADTHVFRFENRALVALDEAGRVLGRVALDGDRAVTGFAIETVYRRVGDVTRFALRESNPVAAFEAHPDKQGNHVSLGDRDAGEWIAMLETAFGVIARDLPELYAEMKLLLTEIVPVGYDAERHLSASYREAIGTVYLTLHPNVMTMAEALVHEFQHNKINLAAHDTSFLVNAYEPRYPSPVRPDPRPLWGILLAVHAFLPVAALYRRMREAARPGTTSPDFERRLSDIDLKNHEGMEMLRTHAEWLPPGRIVMDDLEALARAHMAERIARGLAVTTDAVHVG